MANNFKIAIHRNGCNLQLNLVGDFDGSSAFELYNVLKENLDSAKHVFINIEHLKKIYRIDFIGENSDPIASTSR